MTLSFLTCLLLLDTPPFLNPEGGSVTPCPLFPLGRQEMGANKKLFGKDLSEYDNMDMDDMLDQLTAEEIDLLTRDVDPDVSVLPTLSDWCPGLVPRIGTSR